MTVAIINDEYVPPRTPGHFTIALSTTAIDLGDTTAGGSSYYSHAAFRLWCASDWYIGNATAQLELIPAGSPYALPSATLLGWYAKSASGTPNLIATGAQRRSLT
jgi:hypothetical protein